MTPVVAQTTYENAVQFNLLVVFEVNSDFSYFIVPFCGSYTVFLCAIYISENRLHLQLKRRHCVT